MRDRFAAGCFRQMKSAATLLAGVLLLVCAALSV